MKERNIQYSLVRLMVGLGAMLYIGSQAYAMEDAIGNVGMRNAAEVAGDFIEHAGRGVNNWQREKERQARHAFNEQVRFQQSIIDAPYTSDADKAAAQAEIVRLKSEKIRNNERSAAQEEKSMEHIQGLAFKAGDYLIEEWKAEKNIERDQKLAIIRAVQDRKAKAEAVREQAAVYVDFVTKNPWLIVAIPVAITGGYFTIKHGTQYMYDQSKIPSLATETSILSAKERAVNYLSGVEPPRKEMKDVKLAPDVAARIQETAYGLKNAVTNGSYLKNMLIWGPPGTGKTMSLLRMARSCGLEYMYFAGSDLLGFSVEEGIKKLRELFDYAKHYGKPVLIGIDEIEQVCGKRSNPRMTDKAKTFLNEILTYTGTETREYMVVGLTNRPEDLDEAFLSRCDDKIFVGAPDAIRRREILDHYIEENLMKASQPPQLQRSWFSGWFSSPPPPPAQVKIEANVLSDEARAQIVAKTDGFVGRAIMKLVNQLKFSVYQTENVTLTADIVNRVVDTKVAERKAGLEGYSREDAQAAQAST